MSTWLLILRHGDLRGRALKSELLAQKSGAPCRMVSGRDVNSTQWVAEKNGARKYPTNACTRVLSFPFLPGTKKERTRDEMNRREKNSVYRDVGALRQIRRSGLIIGLMNDRLSVNLRL